MGEPQFLWAYVHAILVVILVKGVTLRNRNFKISSHTKVRLGKLWYAIHFSTFFPIATQPSTHFCIYQKTTIMKIKILSALLCLSLISCIFGDDDNGTPEFTNYEAVILSRTELENSIELQAARPIAETGKIYVISDYLFVNEPNVGFHIINNQDPSNPIVERFLTTPGVTDIISKGESFYINQAVDLVALKFNGSFTAITETKRVRNIFPVLLSPDFYYPNVGADEIVVNWTQN